MRPVCAGKRCTRTGYARLSNECLLTSTNTRFANVDSLCGVLLIAYLTRTNLFGRQSTVVPRGLKPQALRLLAVRFTHLSHETSGNAARRLNLKKCPSKQEKTHADQFRTAVRPFSVFNARAHSSVKWYSYSGFVSPTVRCFGPWFVIALYLLTAISH